MSGDVKRCRVCKMRLWFFERTQDLCRPCARMRGLSRICDARTRVLDHEDFVQAFREGFGAVDGSRAFLESVRRWVVSHRYEDDEDDYDDEDYDDEDEETAPDPTAQEETATTDPALS